MLLTASSGRDVPFPALTALLFLRAVALRVVELLRLVDGCRFDLRPHDVTHGRDPVRHDVPLLAVPLLHEDGPVALVVLARHLHRVGEALDRKSTRLNSSHSQISYAVFCLKKKNISSIEPHTTRRVGEALKALG